MQAPQYPQVYMPQKRQPRKDCKAFWERAIFFAYIRFLFSDRAAAVQKQTWLRFPGPYRVPQAHTKSDP